MSTFVPFFLKSHREASVFDANSSSIFLHRGIPKKETRVCNNTVLPEVCLQKEHPKPFYTTSLKALLSEPKTLLQVCISVWSANCTLLKQVYKANLFVRQKADCSSACVFLCRDKSNHWNKSKSKDLQTSLWNYALRYPLSSGHFQIHQIRGQRKVSL